MSASSQSQAWSAILFLCREVLGVDVEDVSATVRAKRGTRLPAVLSMPETARLLGGLRGKTWLMAALIYGGGLRVSECCQLRVKDIDFDQGLVFVRSGKREQRPVDTVGGSGPGRAAGSAAGFRSALPGRP